ncbi:MAG TPA: hypothetical protein PKL73_15735 [Polyangiaceae bacterium]|jgi:hypothetical protein|nr:MAG: Protein TolB [Deltaproteobacteria bacterium ADurb.Bin207]HNS98402.1 hypothetical protein [Polyangiaceae bacterium]HNZ22014.1 hypothetical protein [Polyangiaceae bacterium]HOD25032.1 hypothetical protein [Polyangiaceae bacterium]HOE47322.1 hypothetical protein [Polyangiaceae bacterium]
MRASRWILPFAGLVLWSLGCSDDDTSTAPHAKVGDDAGTDGSVLLPEAAQESSVVDAGHDVVDEQDAFFDAPVDVAADQEEDAPIVVPKPTPADIDFKALQPIPSGEFLLFNDWNPSPNMVRAISLDGQSVVDVFRAFRIWSLGVSHDSKRIAFACGDPKQAEHYDITLGDAIQHTWIYDVASQSAEVLAFGNLNDECHTFGPDDHNLYVCRRYDFSKTGSFKGWRIGRIDLSSRVFEFLTPEMDSVFALHPQPTPDETEMLYGMIDIPSSPPAGVRSIKKLHFATETFSFVRTDADTPVLSPDGKRYLYRNFLQKRTLWASSLDATNEVQVVAAEVTKPVWSPDGSRVAYLVRDDAHNCDHIEMVASDGSQASAPTRLRDCSTSGEFITNIAWISIP